MKSFDPPVVGILGKSGKLRARPQKSVAPAMVEALEQRKLLSTTSTLAVLAAFNGVDGNTPTAAVADAKGDIFGVTLYTSNAAGTTFGSAVVFEIPAGSSTIDDLATLPTLSNGATSQGNSIVIDSAGNLYVTEAGVPEQAGMLFEIAAGTHTLKTLVTFPAQDQATVTAVDSAGDVFGPGPYEVVKGSGVMTPLENPNGPQVRFNEVIFGPGGNLYGTGTDQNGNSVIADVSPITGDVTILATIDTTKIGTFPQGIAIDSSGDIWGLSQYGGSAGQGTVWELPVHGTTVSLIASFTAATGENPVGPPVFDASGNLYGLTTNDGTSGDGTLFEIPAGAAKSGPVVLVNLTSAEQVSTSAGFVTNSAGIAPIINGDELAIFGGVFGAPASASAAIRQVHPNEESVDYFGALLDYIERLTYTLDHDKQLPKDYLEDVKNQLEQATEVFAQLSGSPGKENAEIQSGTPAANTTKDSEGAPLLARSELASAGIQVSPQVKLSAPLAAIKKMLAAASDDLTSATTLLDAQITQAEDATAEVTTVDSLQTELAVATKAKTEAKIEKEITADEATAAKYADHDDKDYKDVETAKANLVTLEADIEQALNALKA